MSIKLFVHKIAFPPPAESVNFVDFLLILCHFSSFWGHFVGQGKAKFCGQNYYGHLGCSALTHVEGAKTAFNENLPGSTSFNEPFNPSTTIRVIGGTGRRHKL